MSLKLISDLIDFFRIISQLSICLLALSLISIVVYQDWKYAIIILSIIIIQQSIISSLKIYRKRIRRRIRREKQDQNYNPLSNY